MTMYIYTRDYWRVASKLNLRSSNLQLMLWNFQIQYSYHLITIISNMRQVQPETLPKNSNFSSCLQNIKLKNNTT
jgi:hypothetical protein